MFYSKLFTLAASVLSVSAAPTLWLAGDSTTAASGAGVTYQGWGTQIGQYLSIPVQNSAIPGKSTRSFTVQGNFNTMYNSVKSGDIVIIEFGHNEGGGLAGNPGNGVCPGTSLTTTCSDNGQVVYTYAKYLTDAVNKFKSLGASVIVSSQTPNNPFRDTSGTPIYVGYAQSVAASTGVPFVDHFSILKREYSALGANTVNSLFPGDNVHTNSAGANYGAQALLRGVLCGSNIPLAQYISNKNVQPTSC